MIKILVKAKNSGREWLIFIFLILKMFQDNTTDASRENDMSMFPSMYINSGET